MSDQDSRLPPRAEALLLAFSNADRDFDALAARVDATVKATTIGSTPDELLAAPLPNDPGEDETPPPPLLAPRLSDLARAVAQKKGDAGDADIARETLSVASKLRSQTDVLIERMRAAPRAAEPPLRPNAAPQPAEAAPARTAEVVPLAAKAAAPAPVPSGAEPEKPASRSVIWGGLGLSLAAAMALLVFGRQSESSSQTAASASSAERPASELARAAPKNAPSPTGVIPEAVPTVTSEPGAVVGLKAQPEPARARTSTPMSISGKGRAVEAEKVVLDDAPLAAAGPAAKPATAAKKNPAPAAAPAEAPAEPAQDAALKPAAGRTDDGVIPDRPSTGAVQAAMASVMNAARACVAGSTEATPVTVTFAANGSVKSVSVSGAAQGTPAAQCIQSALGRAKVAPFVQPSFSVGVSVRP